MNDDARSGRPSTSTADKNVEKLKKLIGNRRITIGAVPEDVDKLMPSNFGHGSEVPFKIA